MKHEPPLDPHPGAGAKVEAGRGEGGTAGLAQLLGVIRCSRPPIGLIVAAILISLLETASTLWFPILTKQLIDGLSSTDGPPRALIEMSRVQLLLAVLIVGAAAGGLSAYLLSKAGLLMSAALKSHLTHALLAKPVAYFDDRETGEHVSRITNDSGVISRLVTAETKGLVTGILLLIGSAVVLASLDYRLTLVIFGIILAAFVVLAPIFIAMAGITRRINDASAGLSAALARTFSEIRLVKAYTAEPFERERSDRAIEELYSSGLLSARVQSALQPVTSLALTLAILAIFAYGGARVALGTLSVGTLTAFILYIFNIIAPLIHLSTFLSTLQAAKGASGRIHDILVSPSEPVGQPQRRGAATSGGVEPRALRFEGVTLAYGSDEAPALDIGHLVIPSGKSVGVIGPSGAGKTSLVSLLERFYEPTSGEIYWGDLPIRQIPLVEWRANLGYVGQTAPLMSGTIAENIAYGCAELPEMRQLEIAAEAANCLDFVARLERGFDSQVGEAGVRLSGGQRQRIAIARVFMRDPRILLLDEATSNLDLESEDVVRGALRRLMMGRTTIVVTHRLSAVSDVDFIAIVEKGRLVDFGPRADVIRDSEYYRRVASFLSQ